MGTERNEPDRQTDRQGKESVNTDFCFAIPQAHRCRSSSGKCPCLPGGGGGSSPLAQGMAVDGRMDGRTDGWWEHKNSSVLPGQWRRVSEAAQQNKTSGADPGPLSAEKGA